MFTASFPSSRMSKMCSSSSKNDLTLEMLNLHLDQQCYKVKLICPDGVVLDFGTTSILYIALFLREFEASDGILFCMYI